MPAYLAVEVTEADARVLQISASRREGVKLQAAFLVPWDDVPRDENAPVERGKRLRDALKKGKLPVSEQVVLIVPKQSVTVRRLTLPSAVPEELASMAAFEAEKIIPFNVERHIISYMTVGEQSMEGTDVLLAAVDEPVMTQWLATMREANLDPHHADVSSLSLAWAYTRSMPAEGNSVRMLLNVGMIHTEITILRGDQVVASRSVMHGVRHLSRGLSVALGTEESPGLESLQHLNFADPELSRVGDISLRAAETQQPAAEDMEEFSGVDQGTRAAHAVDALRTWFEKLIVNIQRTVEFAQREYALGSPEAVALTGEGVLLPRLDGALHSALGLDIAAYVPAASAEEMPKATIDRQKLALFSHAWGGVGRLAAGEAPESVNLLPGSVIASQIQAERRMHYVITGAVVAVAAAMIFLFFNAAADQRMIMRDRYANYVDDLDEMVTEYEDMENRIEIIRGIRSDNAGALDILGKISEYEPVQDPLNARIKLTRYDYEIGEELRIEGHARDVVDVNNFVRYLQTLTRDGRQIFGYISSDNSPTRLNRRDVPIYQFQINAEFPEEGSGGN